MADPQKHYRRIDTEFPTMDWFGEQKDGKLRLHWREKQFDGNWLQMKGCFSLTELKEIGAPQAMMDRADYYEYDPKAGY